MTKWLAALAAASLAAAPAAAEPIRTAAPAGETESLRGGLGVAWLIALIMVVGAVLIISDDDGPSSP